MKNIFLLLVLTILSVSSYSQNALADACSDCTDNCITLEFFGDNTPSDVLLWGTCYYYDPCIGQEFPNPCDPIFQNLGNSPIINLCLSDSCYTLSVNGLQPDTIPSGVNIISNGDVLESTIYFSESFEVISFSVFGGVYGSNCPDACVSEVIVEVENPCPADLNGDGIVTMPDMLEVLSVFGSSCDGESIVSSNNKSIEELIENSNQTKSALEIVKQINLSNSITQLSEYVEYTIFNLSGQVIQNNISNKIDVTNLSNGVYIFMTESEVRKFVINR